MDNLFPVYNGDIAERILQFFWLVDTSSSGKYHH